MAIYHISTPDDWVLHLTNKSAFNDDDIYYLDNNIDMSTKVSLAYVKAEFGATLDGQGFTVTGIDDLGIFAKFSGTLKNITFKDLNCEKDSIISGVVSEGLIFIFNTTATIDNVKFINIYQILGDGSYGGIFAGGISCTIKNVWIDNYKSEFSTTNNNLKNYNTVLLGGGRWDNCPVLENISIRNSSIGTYQYGGIISGYHYKAFKAKNICIVNCHVSGSTNLGIILGRCYYEFEIENLVIKDCTITVSATSGRAAAICGYTSTSKPIIVKNGLVDCQIKGKGSNWGNLFSSTADMSSNISAINLQANVTGEKSFKYTQSADPLNPTNLIGSTNYLYNLGYPQDIWGINAVDNIVDIVISIVIPPPGPDIPNPPVTTYKIYIKINGVWVPGNAVYIKDGNIWKIATNITIR